MALIYSKPRLKNLSVGSRIAFVRQFRRMTRHELALKIGLSKKNAKRIMARYERSKKVPKEDKLQKIAEILNINVRLISPYDFSEPSDLFYLMLWAEELCPNFILRKSYSTDPENMTQSYFLEHYDQWRKMRKKYMNNEISYEEYWDWKLE